MNKSAIDRALAAGGVPLDRSPARDIADLAELEARRWSELNSRLRGPTAMTTFPTPSPVAGQPEGNWRTIFFASAAIGSAQAVSEQMMYPAGSVAIGTAGSAFNAIWLDPADLSAAGYTTQLRLAGHLHTNTVAPGGTISLNLKPVNTWMTPATNARAGVASVGAAVCSISWATPAASLHDHQVSAAVAHPAANWYVVTWATTAVTATNSEEDLFVRLQYQHV